MKALTGPIQNFLIVICLPLLAAFSPQEKYPGFKPVAGLKDFKSKFAAASANITSIKGQFTQEKTLLALTEKITSQGKLWFKRDNKVRMDYTTPFVYQMIINGDKIYIRDEQKETKLNSGSNKLFQQINTIMIDCMQGTILQSNDFSTRVFENSSAYLIEMTPVTKTMKQFLSTIVLTIDKNSSTPNAIELNESSGDKTLIRLSNKVINNQLSDEVFSF